LFLSTPPFNSPYHFLLFTKVSLVAAIVATASAIGGELAAVKQELAEAEQVATKGDDPQTEAKKDR
jgi:hypothetical protein